MDLRHYVRAIRRGWWIVLVVAVLGGAGAYAHAARSPKIYAASVTFYVATPQINSSTAYGSDQFAQDRANSYAQLLSSQNFARLVLTQTKLPVTSSDLARKISGSAQINTVLVSARIEDTSLPRLRTIQAAVASKFPVYVSEIETTNTIKLKKVSSPPVSAAPIAPRTSVDVVVGFAAGLALGLLIAALREVIDTSVRSGSELEDIAEAPLIGSIVYDSTTRQSPVVTSEYGSRRAEDFRQLRTNLEFVNTAKKLQAIVVTSSVASEGKSSTALNIAATAAERGARVLLIDADLRRPQIADYLGFDPSVGLTTVLTGRLALTTAIRTWGKHGLAVLPSGRTAPNPSELLNSDGMRDLVAHLRRMYDLIVIDTPPVLTVTDAAVCSSFVDGIVLIYRYGKTRRANLSGALHALRAVDARLIGVVLNMRPRRGVDGEQYGTYDSYVGASEPATRRHRVRQSLGRPFRRPPRRRLRRLEPAPPVPGYVALDTPIALAPVAGFRPPTIADAGADHAALGPQVEAVGFAARRARRPLRSGRLSIEHLVQDVAGTSDAAVEQDDTTRRNGHGPRNDNRSDDTHRLEETDRSEVTDTVDGRGESAAASHSQRPARVPAPVGANDPVNQPPTPARIRAMIRSMTR